MRPSVALGVLLLLGFGWLTWPVWSSLTAPDRSAVTSLTPALLVALLGLILVLVQSLWQRTQEQVVAAVVLMATFSAAVRMLLLPRTGGIEPVFALPLLAGAALGAPAGFLAGALACLASSAAMGLIAEPLVGQCLVWGLWGAVGGLLRPLDNKQAWLTGVAVCVPLGVVSGVLLNLIGWTGERTSNAGSFLPGSPALESLQRLWDYTLHTSLAQDLTRGVSSAIAVAFIGLPLIVALRGVVAPPEVPHVAPVQEVSVTARRRRQRSKHLATLWPDAPRRSHDELN